VALVLVLLFTVIVLTIVVSTTATITQGTRGGGINERGAYQALLAAEGEQNTFEARYADKTANLPLAQKLRGNLTPTQLNRWLLANGFTTDPSGANNPSGELTPLKFEGSAGNLTLASTGAPGDGTRKVVLQSYVTDYSPAFNIHADAPLVSYPNVDINGNARVEGESGATSTGTTLLAKTRINPITQPANDVTIAASVDPPSATLTLDSTLKSGKMLLTAGDYVQIGTPQVTYKVTAVKGDQVTIKALQGGTPAILIPQGSEIQRVDSAVTGTFTQTISQTTTIKVSDATFFVEGSDVNIGGMQGVVKVADSNAKTISVEWHTKVPSTGSNTTDIKEGTPIRRNVKGVSSGYTVDGLGQIGNGANTNDSRMRDMNPFNPNANPDLFTYTFGQTKDQMLAVTPYQGWVPPTSASSFSGTVSGIVLIDGSLGLSGSQSLCGSGILIVKGNLTVNGTCDAGFRGAIYVMGDYDQQGNSNVSGSVIAEGATQIVTGTECVITPVTEGSGQGNSCDTKIAGTGQGNGKIVYDRGALLEAGSLLTPPTLKSVQGTWRQR